MRDGGALEVNLDHLLARILGRLLDGGRDLVGLAVADSNVAASIACNDESAETECSPALHDLRAAVDSNDGRFDAGFVTLVAASSTASAAPATAALSTTTTASPAAWCATAGLRCASGSCWCCLFGRRDLCRGIRGLLG